VLAAAAAVAAVPASAYGSTVVVDATGAATLRADRAQIIGVVVRPSGRIRLTAGNAADFKPRCVKKSKRRCVRYDEQSGAWIVLRPVKFIYDGSGFSIRVQSRSGFKITISGVGRLKLNGKGTYTVDGEEHRYDGDVPRIKLGSDDSN
jgi:hypothetical protein